MNWKRWSLIISIILLISINLFLIYKDNSKIARTNYVEKWTAVKEQNLVRKKEKTGVVQPLEQQHVYYDKNVDSFKEFLVKEGDEIEAGTPLFEYSSTNADATREKLEAEKTKLQSELTGIETNISQLESLLLTIPEDKDKKDDSDSSVLSKSAIEQDIYEKELQKSKVEAEITKYYTLIASVGTTLTNLQTNSEIAGTVKEVRHNLKNPVVTVVSNEQQIEGVVKENEVRTIAEGMKVFVYSGSAKKKLEGTISKISKVPVKDPKLNDESKYRFTVQLTEAAAELLHGSHVDMNIVTLEINNALTVPVKSTNYSKKNLILYVMKKDGKIEKRQVEKGFQMGKRQQIQQGVEKGELVVISPPKITNKSPFYTPLKTGELRKKTFTKDMRKKEILRYVGKGFLSR